MARELLYIVVLLECCHWLIAYVRVSSVPCESAMLPFPPAVRFIVLWNRFRYDARALRGEGLRGAEVLADCTLCLCPYQPQ